MSETTFYELGKYPPSSIIDPFKGTLGFISSTVRPVRDKKFPQQAHLAHALGWWYVDGRQLGRLLAPKLFLCA